MRAHNWFRSRRLGLLAPALLLGLAILGCGKTDTGGATPAGESASSPAGASEDVILIGEYGSMTGETATFGLSTHAGIELALEEANAAGGINGKQIKIISYDDRGDTGEAGTVVTRLITSDKVVAILGEVASSLSLAAGRVAQQYGVPMISPASTNPAVTEIGPMVFRVCFIDPYQGSVCAKFMGNDLKATKAAVLYDQSQAYSTGLREAFVKAFTEQGGTIVTEQSYGKGDQDYSAQLTTIRDANPEAIFVPGYYTEVGNIAIQARKLGITVPLVGGDGWDSAKLTEIGGAALDGCYYSNHYSPEDTRPEVQEFVAKLKAKTGQVPDTMAALGYDAARILFDAIKRSPSLGKDDLAKAIGETKDFPGVTGIITLDENRNAQKSAVILQIKDSKVSYLTTVAPH